MCFCQDEKLQGRKERIEGEQRGKEGSIRDVKKGRKKGWKQGRWKEKERTYIKEGWRKKGN